MTRLVRAIAAAALAVLLAGCGAVATPAPAETSAPTATPGRSLVAATLSARPGTTDSSGLIHSTVSRAAPDAAAAADAAHAVDAFAADLYRQLRGRTDGNLVFSPYGAAVALAMTRAGAAGVTLEQMDAVLHAGSTGSFDAGMNAIQQALDRRPAAYGASDLELEGANQLWTQRGFALESAYLDLLASYYGAGVRTADFISGREAARSEINAWVAQRTRDRIREAIPPDTLNSLTRLVVVNALYLKAAWVFPFDGSATAPAVFHRQDGTTTLAPRMVLAKCCPGYLRAVGYQAVSLPYSGGISMIVMLPDPGTFGAFEADFDAQRLEETVAGLSHDYFLTMRLPRFELHHDGSLKDALVSLGMPLAFTPDRADFSRLSRSGSIFLQETLQQTFVSVDEKGSEAAAATAVLGGATGGPANSAEVTVDRPFLFVIRDDVTGAVLFMGRVLDPTRPVTLFPRSSE
jgi:serpin B